MDEATAEQLMQWDRSVVWHGFTQMAEYEPLVIERAEGNWLQDVQGRRFLDGVSSLWCNVHGHRHERINAAIRDQLDRVAHVASLGMGNAPAARLAKRLTEVAPSGLQHVFFSSDGSSAVEVALKLAFQYWPQCDRPRPEKTRFIALDAAYHGDTTGGVSLGGIAHFHRLFGPLLFDPLRVPCPDTYRLPEGVPAEAACGHYLAAVERMLAEHHESVAAIVMEPLVQGAAGMILHPPGFLAGVADLARRFDVLLICDEVATGFGRTGTLFACQQEDVAPDLMCVGKGLTGGYLPMAATLASDRVWRAFLGDAADARQFFHGHTFGGNALAAAAAIASLDLLEQQRVLEGLPEKIQRLRQRLMELADHPYVGSVRQCGMMVGIELVADRPSKRPFDARQQVGRKVCRRALDAGVWVRPLGDVVVLMPPLSIEDDEIDLLIAAVADGIRAELGGTMATLEEPFR